LPLVGPQQRLVLALLIAARGRVLTVGQLIFGVWGENEPPTARNALQGYVHHLRAQVGELLKTESDGYAVDTSGALDAERFEELASAALELATVDNAGAAELCRQALAQWRGAAYSGVTDSLNLISEVAHLDGLRLQVLGDRLDADLALGRHASLIGELEGLTEEFPLQERFRAQLMLALYRSGATVPQR
jgi:DNA-binding SARP family transcriptional activator